MLALNYAEWTFWEAYDPANGTFGNQKVTFDGPNRLILVNDGVTELDVRIDLYSNWKEWIKQPTQTNSQFPEAFSAIGGDPLPGGRVLGTTFFLENGWRIRSWEGDHILTITGNLFTREGDDPVVPTIGQNKVTVNLNTSTLVEAIETGAQLGIDSVQQIRDIFRLHGLDPDNPLVVTPTSRSSGDLSQTIDEDTNTDTVTVTKDT